MMQVPFVDLKAQYKTIKPEIDQAIQGIIEQTAFVGGAQVERFEQNFARFIGTEYAIGCANGTDSIEILLKAMDIGPGDEVIVPANSWISTSEAVSAIGAKPIFVDADAFYTIDTAKIEEKITGNTKAIIPVHLYGQPADMDAVMEVAKKHGLRVMEDCAQAHGAQFKGQKIGSFGDAASFSFYPGKNLGAYGDAGGMVTNDAAIAEKARMISNHGQVKKHDHRMEGRNSRLDGLQAAILDTKLEHLDKWTDQRIKNAKLYTELLQGLPLELPEVKADCKHVFHLYVVQTDNRDELMAYLKDKGVGVAIHYPTPLPLLAAYDAEGYQAADFPVASRVTGRILSLPMFAELSEEQIRFVCQQIKAYFG